MRCQRCNGPIDMGEERTLYGQILCEDCYMDSLSPARACDPWAERSAKSTLNMPGADTKLTETQTRILQFLKETEGAEIETISEKLQIKRSDIEREIATLRHMGKIGGELKDGKKIIHLR